MQLCSFPKLFLLFLCPLYFHINLRISLSLFTKKANGIFDEITLNLLINLGRLYNIKSFNPLTWYISPLFRCSLTPSITVYVFYWPGLICSLLSLSLSISYFWQDSKWYNFDFWLFIDSIEENNWFLYIDFISCSLTKLSY